LGSGDNRTDVDVNLRPVPVAAVAGTLSDEAGPVAGLVVHLMPLDNADGSSLLELAKTTTDPAGGFRIAHVPAGQYTLYAERPLASPGRGNGAAATPAQAAGQTPTRFGAWAKAIVSVGDRNVLDIALALRPGVRISGRLQFDGAAPPPPPEALRTPSPVAVNAVLAQPRFRTTSGLVGGTFEPDAHFAVTGIPPGRYFLRAPVLRPWVVQSIVVDGRDMTDASFVVDVSDIADVVITYADRSTELVGRVESSDGSVDSDATVFAFPVDRTRWRDSRASTRAFQSTRASRGGAFTLTTVPGDYLVVAIREDAFTDWPDPAFLAKLATQATTVHVVAGQKTAASLKTVKLQ
jgi:hypothetical protein